MTSDFVSQFTYQFFIHFIAILEDDVSKYALSLDCMREAYNRGF